MIKSKNNNKCSEILSLFGTILCSFITSIVFCMEFQEPELLSEVDKGSRFLNIVYNLQYSLMGTMVSSTIIFVAILLFALHIRKKTEKHYIVLAMINFVIAIVWLMGESFRVNNTLNLLHSSSGQIVKSALYLVAITYFLTQIGIGIDLLFNERKDVSWNCKGKIAGFYRKYPYRCSFLTLMICWSPQIILSYPGNMCIDAWNQMLQFFGYQKFSSHHPPIHTWMMGVLEKIGLTLGSGNLGLFLFILIQTLCFAAVLSYMFYLMREMKSPVWLLMVSFGTVVVSPYYTEYLGLIVKDNIYSYAVLLFVIELIYMLRLKEKYWHSWKHIVLLFVSVVGSILFRNNGIYVIYPMVFLLLCGMLINLVKGKCQKKLAVRMVIILMVPILFSSGVSSFLMSHYNIEKNSIRDALSFPFQQTARYVKEYGDEVTEEEREVINKVLKYNKLAKKYDPKISDPIKATFREKAETEDLINYFKVWIQQGIKHPMVYIEATMNQNYYLLYPMVENNTIYDETIYPKKSNAFALYKQTGIHEIGWIQKLDVFRTGFNKLVFSLPVIGLLASIAAYNILLIYLIYYALEKKLFPFILVALPALLSDAIIVMAPVIKGHPRYAFPIVYAMPLLVAYYLYLLYQKEK